MTDSKFDCPDEDWGCPYTLWAVCALDKASTMKEKVAFMTCWDESPDQPDKKANACAKSAGIDFEAVFYCHADGDGLELLHEAAKYFMERFPEFSSVGGFFHVPHIFVNDQEQNFNSISYDALLQTLCDAGAEAAACSSTSSSVAV